MEPGKLAKQILTFQKTLFENSFKTIGMIQEQTGQILFSFMNMCPWMTDDGKKVIDDSIKGWKNAREEFKKIVDDGFSKFEEIFNKN